MPVKKPKTTKKLSNAERAIAIYRTHLKEVEDGKHDESRSWRQTVLESFGQSINTTPASLSTIFANCQKKVGLRVNSNFEIEGVGARGGVPVAATKPVTTAAPPIAITPATGASSQGKPTAKQRAEKVHADLIALCEDEIEEAFQDLEELIDNADQQGDAKTLRKFTRHVRSACKRIDDQLATKAMLDKKQATTILTGIQKASK